MVTLRQDLAFAWRGLITNPAFALTAIAAAALGIGATTTVFSVVDRLLIRPLPYAHESRLVSTGMLTPLDTNEFLFAENYVALKKTPQPFEAVTAFQAGSLEVDLNEENPIRLRAIRVERNFFTTLGVRLAAGRTFSEAEDQRHGPPAVIVSQALWRNRFRGSLNRTIQLDGQPVLLIGALPEDFELPTLTGADILLPLGLDPQRERNGRAFRVFARLPDGMSIARARQELSPFATQAIDTVPPRFRKEIRWAMQSVRERQAGSSRLAAYALTGASLAVLLIACANIANLLLARAVAREREFAVRAALGASRGRLIRQLLTEATLLGIIGGAAGCAVAWALLRLIVTLGPEAMPRLEQASLDPRVLLLAMLLSAVASVLFGLAPAWRQSAAVRGTRATKPSRGGLRSALVAAQVAFSILLLTGAGLLLRTLWTIENTRSGLDPEHLVTARFVLGQAKWGNNSAAQVTFFHELEQRLSALPGAQAVAITDSLPPTGGTRGRPYATIDVEGRAPLPEGSGGMVAWRYVTRGYFEAMGIRFQQGGPFLHPAAAAGDAIILNETLARRMFPNGHAVGQRMLRTAGGQWHTVIGVVADVRNRGLERKAEPEYYIQRKSAIDDNFRNAEPPLGWRSAVAVIRTPVAPALAAAQLRETLHSLDATLPVTIETMADRLRDVTQRPRFYAWLLTVFAAAGLMLAAIGLFGVTSYLVAQRQRELGIRVALGATPRDLQRLVLGHAARWIATGTVVGTALAGAAVKSIRSLLVGVEPTDPAAWIAAAALLGVVGMLAAARPAWLATRVDAASALKQE